MLLTLFGIVTPVKVEQSRNAPSPQLMTLDGIA